MYDEVYRDSEGRETPSVKLKSGNYRRQNVVGIGFLTSGFNFSTPFQEEHQQYRQCISLSSILITGVSPDSNLIHSKYAKMKIVIFLVQAKQSLYC